MKSFFVFLCFTFFLTATAFASDVIRATSEDISEFDQLFVGEPAASHQKNPSKGKKQGSDARKEFYGKQPAVGGKKMDGRKPKGPPRHDRERGRKNPPPPPGGGSGSPPPPPPTGGDEPPPQ